MGKRSSANETKIATGQWITTYADLMNNLLVFFMLLYIMSVIDMQKFKTLTSSFAQTFLGTTTEIVNVTPGPNSAALYIQTDPNAIPMEEPNGTPTPEPSGSLSADANSAADATPSASPEESPAVTPAQTDASDIVSLEEYGELYERINLLLDQKGYSDLVNLEMQNDVIYIRFREGVFFYPDSSDLKPSGYPIIKNISSIMLESYDLIGGIDISGHTARLSKDPPSKTNLFSWDLSTDRALTVLRYLVQQCDLPQEKLSVTGYSCNQLYVEGDAEEQLAQNRRVEIRLTRLVKPVN